MKSKKRIALFAPVAAALAVCCIAVAVLGVLSKNSLAILMILPVFATAVFIMIRLSSVNRQVQDLFDNVDTMLAPTQRAALANFPIPAMTVNKSGEIIWYNALFRERVLGGEDIFGCSLAQEMPKLNLEEECPPQGYQVDYGGKQFSAYAVKAVAGRKDQRQFSTVYFFDDTKLKLIAREYFLSRPCVITIMVDNYAELLENARENERSQLAGELDYLIENFARVNGALYRKVEKDRFLVIMEERYLRPIIENRFPLLDDARKICANERMPATLSIGVGRDAVSLKAAEEMSNQALDMALGRGGDQAAMKTKNGYDFFGGLSKGVEKRTKVRTRIIATALEELISSSSNVLLMGHRFADLDCLGADIGLYAAVRSLGKPAAIVIDRQRNLAKSLYELYCQKGSPEAFVEPEDALDLIDEKTLLIVSDVHTPSFLESAEVYQKCTNVVVIDHHRKMVNYIDRAVLFYHEPHASSASEMVAELVQYLGDAGRSLGSLEAGALLSGIMLDTKNFVLRTGVRTFEAAAYLRRMGADTVEVRKLFSSSMEAYQEKNKLVAGAQIYRRCAISMTGEHLPDVKVTAAQAADELLTINDVAASFVLYEESENVVALSGRSMGEINVQLIMEKLGGGGHLTMAGAQLRDLDLEQVYQKLLEAIDEYYKERE